MLHFTVFSCKVQIEVTDSNPAMFNLEWLDACSEKVKFGKYQKTEYQNI
jgi:hypothetical protein